MVNACADPDFLVREGEGGGPSPMARFFYVSFGGFKSKIFRGCGEGSNYLRGGGPNANFYRI